ncbi:ABC transporter ATP-binding protein [Brachybacterium sp. MASK1Z-5]|uniref:ABC transporter ATP-binding protein n=1 Tax=Brachybacterium halotolerans TaxID=2795215 RepID=A0ABS1BC62_9MICO|nr:ABC transporter ATP-binding protein [Brachybacterium halotolerans]
MPPVCRAPPSSSTSRRGTRGRSSSSTPTRRRRSWTTPATGAARTACAPPRTAPSSSSRYRSPRASSTGAVRLHQSRSGSDEVRERSAALLSRVGLEPAEHYLDRFPHELSGGERQRVSFARALAAGPSVLLADEPVSMLDVTIRKAMLDLIDDLRREEDLAVLYITHDLGSARRYSSEVLVMHEGRVVERGESAQVISDPQDEYTRRLLAAAPDPRRSLGTPGA